MYKKWMLVKNETANVLEKETKIVEKNVLKCRSTKLATTYV